jgi:hypothetical protein
MLVKNYIIHTPILYRELRGNAFGTLSTDCDAIYPDVCKSEIFGPLVMSGTSETPKHESLYDTNSLNMAQGAMTIASSAIRMYRPYFICLFVSIRIVIVVS